MTWLTAGAARIVAVVTAAVVLALSSIAVAAPATAQTDEAAAERAAAEIQAARERANQAAEDYFAAESREELLQLEQERLQLELDDLAAEVAELESAVTRVAVNRFVSSGSQGIPILTDFREPNEQLQADVLATLVAESGATTLDDYEAARQRLVLKRQELEANERELERAKEDLLQLQADAEAEVQRLREIEAKRLEDEAVAAALAARQREEARRLRELERRQAEAARKEAEAQAAAQAAEAAAAPAASSSGGNTTGRQGASGGAAGGRTGGGGSGTTPRAAPTSFVDSMACPVLGGSAYGDTWGAPRSGGRRHQGVDMLAPTGTPLQAVVSGTVTHRSNRLGGVTLALQGDNGNRYYYAHLSAYEGGGGRVAQGQVIGYVGDTGNATGTPHLHFEIRPNGGVPVNPYPSVKAAGC